MGGVNLYKPTNIDRPSPWRRDFHGKKNKKGYPVRVPRRIGGKMKRGPKATPTEELHSWRAQLAARKNEIQVAKPTKPLPCPRRLQGEARVYWKDLSKTLHANGMLSEVDVTALVLLCQLLAERDELSAKIGGKLLIEWESGERLNPLLRQRNDVDAQIRRICNDFGMTPTSRIGLPAPKQKVGKVIDGTARFPKG